MRSKAGWVLLSLMLGGVLLPGTAAAQYGEGQKYLGVHIGMSGVGSTAAFGASADVSYNKNISIGGWFDYWSYGQSFGTADWDVSYIALAGTGAWHFPIKSNAKLDPFLGLALGYFVVNSSTSSGSAVFEGDASRIFFGGFGGARYFFKPNVAGVARVGFGASYLTLGVDFKF